MARIRSTGNKDTEIVFIQILRKNRLSGWRRKQLVFGRPDFVFYKPRVAIFIDGCFWHGCPKHGGWPKSNTQFWVKKLMGNIVRDRLVTRTLRGQGWLVVRIWEHDLAPKMRAKLVLRLRRVLCTEPPT